MKAFNTLSVEHILNPVVRGHPADVFPCTDEADARTTVSTLPKELGFNVDLGRNIAFEVLGS